MYYTYLLVCNLQVDKYGLTFYYFLFIVPYSLWVLSKYYLNGIISQAQGRPVSWFVVFLISHPLFIDLFLRRGQKVFLLFFFFEEVLEVLDAQHILINCSQYLLGESQTVFNRKDINGFKFEI